MTIYLYVKTHNKTGLKYLGKTEKKDPHKYKGSGRRWLNHLKRHGSDYTTEIIKICHSNDEIKEFGLHYSKLWNVVDSAEWANLKEEAGDGGYYKKTNESIQKTIETKIKNGTLNPTSVESCLRGVETRRKNGSYKTSPEAIAKRRQTLLLRYGTLNVNTASSIENNSKTYELTSPLGEHIIVKNLAKFCRENGLNQGNMVQVSKGIFKQHKKWKCKEMLFNL